MANIMISSNNKELRRLDGSLNSSVLSFLTKLSQDRTNPSLHIEPIENSRDKRARTGRVNKQYRAVLFEIDEQDDATFVLWGVYNHDDAIDIARKLVLRVNPINGILEALDDPQDDTHSQTHSQTHSHTHKQAHAHTPRHDKKRHHTTDTSWDQHSDTTWDQPSDTAGVQPSETPAADTTSAARSYSRDDLINELGLPAGLSDKILQCRTDDDFIALGEADELAWRQSVILDLAVNKSIAIIKEEMGMERPTSDTNLNSDKALLKAAQSPSSRLQFTYADNEDELKRVIEGADMGKWRVFLHPKQRHYVEQNYNGPFRLTGGAGTGKTVVLLHRAQRLLHDNPDARIVLATFNRALAQTLDHDLNVLNPHLKRAEKLGEPGIYVASPDSMAARVFSDTRNRDLINEAGNALGYNGITNFSGRINNTNSERYWKDAVENSGVTLDPHLATQSFLDSEYHHVVLGKGITTKPGYARVARPGRGARLGRDQRLALWEVFTRFHDANQIFERLTFGEILTVAGAALDLRAQRIIGPTGRLADHILIDEGQDLSPCHWIFLRALAAEGPNDLFICEDNHQRIYSHPVHLSDYGIHVRGRSRKLTLNYRTTAETRHLADRILAGASYVDLEGEKENVFGYTSVRSGPRPRLLHSDNLSGELDTLSELLHSWIDGGDGEGDGIAPESIGVLCRTTSQLNTYVDALAERGLPVVKVTVDAFASSDAIRILTMHRSKGLEFARVIIAGIGEEELPMKSILRNEGDDERKDILLRERSLLYVAATRARDMLVLSYSGQPSEFVNELSEDDTLLDAEQ